MIYSTVNISFPKFYVQNTKPNNFLTSVLNRHNTKIKQMNKQKRVCTRDLGC